MIQIIKYLFVIFYIQTLGIQNKKMWIEVNPSLIDTSDFDCVLCYRTLWKPVVTPCGHTYCMVNTATSPLKPNCAPHL